MAEIIRKTEATFFGPWLLDKAALDSLDEIIDEQWTRLESYRKQRIRNAVRRDRNRLTKAGLTPERSEAEEVRRRLENEHPDDGRTITLTLASGNKVRVNNFGEAADDVNCKAAKITKMEVRLCCAGVIGELKVPASGKNHELSLLTLPEASEQADELFVKLHRWAEQHKPTWTRQLCGTRMSFMIPIVAAIFFAIFGTMLTSSFKETWKDEVRELVDKGVTPADHSKALELLLRDAARVKTDTVVDAKSWFTAVAIVGLVVGTVVAILLIIGAATTTFEIGKGVASTRWQKGYDRFLRVTLPGFLIFGVLASIIAAFAYDFIRTWLGIYGGA